MNVTRLNHAVLYVRDARRTAAFYQDVLSFQPVVRVHGFPKGETVYRIQLRRS